MSHLPPGHLDLTEQPHSDRMKYGRRVTKVTYGATKAASRMGGKEHKESKGTEKVRGRRGRKTERIG